MLDNEAQLVKSAKGGDGQSFGVLYEHYSQAIYRFIVVKVSSRQEAEDITHEVFLKAWQKLPAFKQKGFPFSSWLYRIARNKVIDHYRTKKAHLSLEDLTGQLEEEFFRVGAAQRSDINFKLDLEAVLSSLDQLTADQREVIEMRFFQDLSPKEIAQITKKKEGTIRILQHRATQKLKQALEKQQEDGE
ncbi:MAG: hypothetical protein COU10_02500 [Candidatus Harrisonbacteria bacterium CG10_big_fil_rev_8_21_14_0_10_45_28]|uniref:RNA polymerase subunit sigma-70 n=1 Tax=Candidatus Harrisonbacteria bacterium CG10_big_fil_rev_8_21_14_0_10_45_28 TaxID=1974586 RepID=A0A2H0UN60_9BACT|nr:MAG: hypothetical protein COU10_02500 [Candidatus Harrisonbacteria bacterium CG10_big_fil_rev_8_21_14_0_10_45_28]